MSSRLGAMPASAPISGPAENAKPTSASVAHGAIASVASAKAIAASDIGATSERRRLSSIFQRLIARRRQRPAWSRIGSSCQSPRVQRCTREAATSAWNGASSITVMSVTAAQRASEPSSRSWLRIWFSGRRPPSTACIAWTWSRPLPANVPSPNTSW